jgi:glycerol-3-phosphate acyltransferase PlsY
VNPWWWLLVPATYLLGSVSFAWIAGRLKGIDLRQHGSGNLGATNAGRVLGWHWFAAVFTADLAKGLLPVLAARQLDDPWLPLALAAAAVLGHVFTCFHGFKGGKAVATALGVLTGLVPITAGVGLGAWILVWAVGKVVFRLGGAGAVGPASMVATLAVVPTYLVTTDDPFRPVQLPTTGFILLLAILVLVRHRDNLRRLFAGGQTPEVGSRKSEVGTSPER